VRLCKFSGKSPFLRGPYGFTTYDTQGLAEATLKSETAL
jgi:hypothetical protein